jgi:hypothetical protein
MFACASASAVRPVAAAARTGGATRRSVQMRPCSTTNVASAAGIAKPSVVGLGGGVGVSRRSGVVVYAEDGKEGAGMSKAAAEEAEDMPPWERKELEKKAAMEKGGLPWPAYLGFSAIVCIASVGSCFELAYGNPIFGVVGLGYEYTS